MRRRKFLTATAGVSLAALAAGCQSVATDSLNIAMLEGSIPPQLIQAFKQQRAKAEPVAVIPADSLLKLYEKLQGWRGQSQHEARATTTKLKPVANWLTLGDYWLSSAIQQGLIQPVDIASLEHWQELPNLWPRLLRRDSTGMPSETGEIWGVPYRWSSLAILYNPAKLSSQSPTLTQWEDLLRPELRQKVILPDHPRLVIGLGLKALGTSANVDDPGTVSGLTDFLQALHLQVRVYSSDHYLESLIIGDANAVVGWAADIHPILKQYRQFSAVVPGPGTLASADLWVQPQMAPPISFADRWPDFCLTADFADQFASYSQGISPRFLGASPDRLPDALKQQPVLSPSVDIQANTDFLLPLSESAHDRYAKLWKALRV